MLWFLATFFLVIFLKGEKIINICLNTNLEICVNLSDTKMLAEQVHIQEFDTSSFLVTRYVKRCSLNEIFLIFLDHMQILAECLPHKCSGKPWLINFFFIITMQAIFSWVLLGTVAWLSLILFSRSKKISFSVPKKDLSRMKSD